MPGLWTPVPSGRNRCGLQLTTSVADSQALVAREAATADLLTDGRLQLGMGAGHIAAEYAETGMAFDRGALRVERLAEAVGIVKRLLEGEAVTADGRFYRISGHRVHPRPVPHEDAACHAAQGSEDGKLEGGISQGKEGEDQPKPLEAQDGAKAIT